ncbi:protein of unknown function DUF1080 [Emticicia oligotrophica DSM 17448]|uniref:PA14 domain-containing protein n=1 Tax=Emticicia oligotrophica (strain DSM 17448 / CIP 109782 / MTCC 6937 / GPTSA100-15) TaxID=929562 RepID=A0ABM5N266_EMTOG|nr:family 16 glycoside hydrolase [Emticicia oligotrophica]AFK03535.1 protein of unknown function DUF1080 [Emticicia oligotrophica DSM 17448]
MTQNIIKKLIFCSLWASATYAQQVLPLNDMSAFRPIKENWSIVGNISASIDQTNSTTTQPGTGILSCKNEIGKYGTEKDILTVMEHGDLDLDLDFMMAKGSNSGIYLQGRYEIQLFDSWGKKTAKYSDLGGIYERWDESKPEGSKGYEGVAPRLNVAKAPGLWQNIKISFQAPRFDANGKKISNAKILSIILNGILIHENVELSGPTRGAIVDNEVSAGPIRFQGDHGNVAFRNIKYKSFNQKMITFSDLKFGVYKGNFRTVADIEKIKPETSGNGALLNWAVSNAENEFAVKYAGKIKVPDAGTYTFSVVHGGNTQMNINGKDVFKNGWLTGGQRQASIELPAGEVDFELYYWKADGWLQPSLGLYVESETVRKHPLHSPNSTLVGNPTSPIYLNPSTEPVVFRSFMDINSGNKNKRIVHAVSVGNKENLHYTYDLDNGALFQIWKGSFLNTTPMWNDRGDGSSRPMGSLTLLGDEPLVNSLASPTTAWSDLDATYRPRGYELDENGNPTFKYDYAGANISDKTTPSADGKMLNREVSVKGTATNLYARLASAKTITQVDSLYIIDGQYYIKVTEGTVSVRQSNGMQELIAPLAAKVAYSIIW